MRKQHERRLKVYIETSVINHLDAPDRQDWMEETIKLWDMLKDGVYDVVIGEPVMSEIDRCYEPKRSFMTGKIAEIKRTIVGVTDEAKRLAKSYILFGGLKKKSHVDAMHIALATLSSCDAIVSWNFSHIVTVKAMTAVDAVNLNEHLTPIKIISPAVLLGEKA